MGSLIGVTLSAWYNYYTGKGICTFSDPEGWGEWANNEQELENILYGYGFSYSHKREPSLVHPYPNVGFAEDAPFFLKLRELYGDDRVILWRDEEGLCVHIMHRANTAQVLGTSISSASQIANLAVTELKPFQRMIDCDFFRFSPWRPPVKYPVASLDVPVAGGSAGIPVGSSVIIGPSASVAITIPEDAELEEEEDVRPRLRESTLTGSSAEIEVGKGDRPRADTWRN